MTFSGSSCIFLADSGQGYLNSTRGPPLTEGKDVKNRRLVATVVVLAALAFNVLLLWLYHHPQPKRLIGDENYYVPIGQNISQGSLPNHDPLWPPLYGELLGRIFILCGARLIFVQLFQVLLWGLTAYLFWRILLKLSPSPLARRTSLLLFLFCPELAAFSHYFWPETIHLFFWVVSLWLLIEFPEKLWSVAAAGAVLGLALNTKSLMKPFLPVLLVTLLLSRCRLSAKEKFFRAGAGVLMLLLILLPVLLSHQRSSGRLALPDSATFSVWAGLLDKSRHDYVDDTGFMMAVYLNFGPDIWARNAVARDRIKDIIKDQGLLRVLKNQASKQYFRLFSAKTFFTKQLPGGERQAYHIQSSKVVLALRSWSYLVYGLILVAGAAGLAYIRLSRKNPAVLFLLFIFYNLGLFLFSHAITRYTIQMLPMLAYFAGLAICRLFSSRVDAYPQEEFASINVSRDVLAAFLGLLMAFLSFGPMVFNF